MPNPTLVRLIQFAAPFRLVLLVLAAIAFTKVFGLVSSLFLPLILSSIIAASLIPIVSWLTRRGFRRGLAVFTLLLSFFCTLAAAAFLIVPRLYNELSKFVDEIPSLKHQALSLLPDESPFRNFAAHLLGQATATGANTERVVLAGSFALAGLTDVLLVVVFTSYLVIEGPTIVAWLTAFFTRATRSKLRQTFSEVSDVIFAYVTGQVVTSVLSFLYVLLAMRLLHVPSGLLLATLAGIFDILPVIGFVLAVVPAMLFALHVSAATSLYVLALYVFYHGLENYLICPAVYGNRMRISSFVVLLSLLVAGMIGGVEGMIVILPIVASYPIVERIWLRPLLNEETVDKHAEIENKSA